MPGETGSVLADLAARLNADADDDDAWALIFQAALDLRQADLVMRIMTARHQRRGDGAAYAYRGMIALLQAAPSVADAAWLAESIPEDSAFFPIFLYGRGLLNAERGSLDETSAMLRRAAFYASQTVETIFATDRAFAGGILGQMVQQANLLEPTHYRPARRLDAPRLVLPERLAAGAGPLIVACCDEAYLEAYGDRFLASLSLACPDASALVNLINPTEAGMALCRALAGRFANAAFASETAPALPAYYASDRLLIAEAVMERYGRDVILSDIDSVFPDGFAEVMAEAGKPSVAYIACPAVAEPSLRIDACLLGVRADAAGRRFLKTAADYLKGKLAEEMPLWTVDQAALFRARCLHPQDCVPLNDRIAPRFPLPGCIKAGHTIDHGARLDSRGGKARYDISFDSERRPLIRLREE